MIKTYSVWKDNKKVGKF